MSDTEADAGEVADLVEQTGKRQKQPIDLSGKSLGYRTIWHVQHAPIKPPALKLLLLNVAIHVNSITGVAFPGIALLATECSLSRSHTKRLLSVAKAAWILTVASHGGGRTSNRYQFDLDVLSGGCSVTEAPIPDDILERLRGSTVEPGSAKNPVHGRATSQSTLEPAAGSPMSKEPHRPQRPQSLGGGGKTIPAGPASPAPWVVPALPVELDVDLFRQVVELGPAHQVRVNALAKKAVELVQQGYDINEMATTTVSRGYRDWCKPPKIRSRHEMGAEHDTPHSQTGNQAGRSRWGEY